MFSRDIKRDQWHELALLVIVTTQNSKIQYMIKWSFVIIS